VSTTETEDDLVLAPDDAKAPKKPSIVLVSVAATVFALLAMVLAVIVLRDRPTGDARDRTEISTTAAQMAEAITAIDPPHRWSPSTTRSPTPSAR
jgi:hypothetical protein